MFSFQNMAQDYQGRVKCESAMEYIEKSRSGDKQFVHSLITLEDVFCRPHPKISWAMMGHLPTISGYAATLVIP